MVLRQSWYVWCNLLLLLLRMVDRQTLLCPMRVERLDSDYAYHIVNQFDCRIPLLAVLLWEMVYPGAGSPP